MIKFVLKVLFALLVVQPVYSQNPGGVKGSKYWIKNEIQALNGSNSIKNVLNFHPAIIFNIADSTLVDEGSIKSEFTFFAIFKSKAKSNNKIAKIKSDLYNITLYPDAIKINDSLQYQQGDVKEGIMVCFKTNKNKLDHNRKIIFKLFNQQNHLNGKNTQILEFIYYPRMLNKYEQNKVETYLSVKYGISLLNNKPYIIEQNKKIWNKDSTNVYQHRITGLGRLDESNLYQKQSLNNLGKEVVMGVKQLDSLNMLNHNNIENGYFLLWGDNDENFQMQDAQSPGKIKILDRKWRIQLTKADSLYNENYKIRIKDINISSHLSGGSTTKFVWLAMQNNDGFFDLATNDFLKSTGLIDGYWEFENVNWDIDRSGSDLFTVIVATDSEIQNLLSTQQLAKAIATKSNDSDLVHNVNIYPNPVKSGTEVTVYINFHEKIPVILRINNLVGQLLHEEDLGEITTASYKFTPQKEGVYLINVITPTQKYFQKIVVKQ